MNNLSDPELDRLIAAAAASVDGQDTPHLPTVRRVTCDVLIADDAGPSREILTAILRNYSQGLRLRAAKNGEEGLALYRETRAHVCLLDIDMPGIHGIDLMKRIRAIDADAFVAIVSGSSSAVNVRAALASGANAFVVKPFTPQRIVDVLMRYEKVSGRKLAPAQG